MDLSNELANAGRFSCNYCNRHFQFQDNYEKHFLTCSFFFSTKIKRDRLVDAIETLPTPTEQYHLIQHCLVKIAKLEKEVTQLREKTGIKRRIAIQQFLDSISKPDISFQEWILQIPVTFEDLNHVFHHDLTDGMKHCMKRLITASTDILPITAFQQKNSTIYIYSKQEGTNNRWIIMGGEEFDKWMNRFAHRFLQEFIQWQIVQSEIKTNDADKEKIVEYMRKINGLHEERRRSDFRKWLFGQLAKDISQSIAGYEFV